MPASAGICRPSLARKKGGSRPPFSRQQKPAALFLVFALAQSRAEIHAVLDAGGKKYSEGYTLVTREDLGSFFYFEPAVQHVSIVDVKIPENLKVGYIMGAGDDIPNVLRQIGMNVTLISPEKLATGNLAQYGTIVLGVRAYDTQKALVANNQKLLDFDNQNGLAFLRKDVKTGDAVLVALNMTAENKNLKVDLAPFGVRGETAKVLVPGSKASVRLDNLALPPFDVLIARIQ